MGLRKGARDKLVKWACGTTEIMRKGAQGTVGNFATFAAKTLENFFEKMTVINIDYDSSECQ